MSGERAATNGDAATGSADPVALAERLGAVCLRRLGSATVEDLRRLSGGASQETWSFDLAGAARADGAGAREHLVLRRAPGGRRGTTAVSPEVEAAVQDAAGARGVPVAAVRFVLEPDDGLGAGYVMERLPGESIAPRILRDPDLAGARASMARQCGRILARLHAAPTEALPELALVDGPAQIAQYRSIYDAFDEPRPIFELAFRRLADTLPPVERPTLVHGDFRNGNFLVDADGIRAVLDWELVHRGDPMEDLGWLCVNSWRFGASERPVGGFGDLEDLLAGYAEESGRPVDRDRVLAWQAFGTLKWGVMCMIQAFAGGAGRGASVEKTAIGRRVSETEADLMRLLAPGLGGGNGDRLEGDPLGAADAVAGLRAVRPNALELLAAVRAFLLDEVRPAFEGKAAFDALVAANALGIVERELTWGAAHEASERAGLLALLGGEHDGRTTAELVRALAAEIRSGARDLRDPALLRHLHGSADRKLAVDNPKYRPAEDRRPPEGDGPG